MGREAAPTAWAVGAEGGGRGRSRGPEAPPGETGPARGPAWLGWGGRARATGGEVEAAGRTAAGPARTWEGQRVPAVISDEGPERSPDRELREGARRCRQPAPPTHLSCLLLWLGKLKPWGHSRPPVGSCSQQQRLKAPSVWGRGTLSWGMRMSE